MDMNLLLKAGIVFLAASIGIGAKYLLKKDDTIIEEVAEDVVCKQTGVCIDITPDSPEK